MRKRFPMDKIRVPEWHCPKPPKARPELKVYNSLTRTKEPFHTINPNTILWYSCGPTVYDSAHMGHARNYVSIDINRRLLQDYFGYNVVFVQNVTDIDDKIIVRAREKFLFEKYSKGVRDSVVTKENRDFAVRALSQYMSSAFKNLPSDVPAPPESLDAFKEWATKAPTTYTQSQPKFNLHVKSVVEGFEALESSDAQTFLSKIERVLVPLLDKEQGHEVTDHSVFRDLSSYFEADFNQDMAKLNVLKPHVTTRVSEYVPEIVQFVEKIIDRNYAYATSDGSVYFDVQAFDAAPDHDYAKLQPWNKGVQELIDDGEGSLSLQASGKRSRSDFALWKSSKPGEPAWDSPWGRGRPGWHIECSVMACHVLGPHIDIHTGGIDLAFPHHDNELAQSEACYDCEQWVNYFLHTGHLHIEGQKMSKSLKNFISIKEALKLFSSRQLRLAFAFQPWNTQLDFKMSLAPIKAYESTLSNFFQKVKALGRESTNTTSKKVDNEDLALLEKLKATQQEVDTAFADNLNTSIGLQHMGSLIQSANEYIIEAQRSGREARIEILDEIARWVTHILSILGFETSEIGWCEGNSLDGESKASSEEVALPYVQVLSRFRDEVRKSAISQGNTELLKLCDKVRDTDLFGLGIVLDDRGQDNNALVKFISESEKNEIIQEREAAAANAQEKALRKAEQQMKLAKQEEERRERAKIDPRDMFKGNPEYSKFDEQGVPSHDSSGEPLSKSAIKKLQKQWQAQEKLFKQYK